MGAEADPSGRTIVLHLGAHKTGSTSLQRTLATHRAALERAGLSFVGPAGAYPHLYSAFLEDRSYFIHNRLSGLTDADIRARDARVLDEISQAIEAAPGDTVILSSEFLCKLSPSEMATMRDHFGRFGPVRAVYFYRDLRAWIASDSQQLAKVGRATGPTPFDIGLARVSQIPLQIAEVFGPQASTFIRFEDAVEQGLCACFLEQIGHDAAAIQGFAEIYANEGISANAVRALYVFNRLFPFGKGEQPQALLERLRELPGPKYQIDGFTADQIADYATHRNVVQDRLGLRLEDPSALTASDTPDGLSQAIVEIVEAYTARQRPDDTPVAPEPAAERRPISQSLRRLLRRAARASKSAT